MDLADLDAQLQALVDNAPQDGTTPQLVAAIAPALRRLASQLKHSQYYVVQLLDENWVVTVVASRTQADVDRHLIYAFPTLADVSIGSSFVKDPNMIALPVPTANILFQLAAMEGVDSVIFFEVPGQPLTGTEIRRVDLQMLIQEQLRQHSELPPDIA